MELEEQVNEERYNVQEEVPVPEKKGSGGLKTGCLVGCSVIGIGILLVVAVIAIVVVLIVKSVGTYISDADADDVYEVYDEYYYDDTIEEQEEEDTGWYEEEYEYQYEYESIDDLPVEPIGGEYILPNSDSQYLTMTDLEGLSAEECRIARNELYARHGRRFDDAELQAYFDACSWYTGTINPEDFNEAEMFNVYETANRELIIQYEEEQGYR